MPEQCDAPVTIRDGDVKDALGEQEGPLGLHPVAGVPPLFSPAIRASARPRGSTVPLATSTSRVSL